MDSKTIYDMMIDKCPDTPRNKHYLKRYSKFIESCIENNRRMPECTYTENHHILPKSQSFWPEFISFIDNPWNKAVLTYRQHFIAHWLLYKSLGNTMSHAFKRMCDVEVRTLKGNLIIGSRTYEKLKECVHDYETSKVLSEETKNKIKEKRKLQIMPPCSDEKKEKIRNANLGRKRDASAIEKQKESIKNRHCSKHPRARTVHIYDSTGELRYTSRGNMRAVCEENGLPFSIFRKSLVNNEIIKESEKRKNGKRAEIRRPFLGWKAVYAD